MSAGLGARRGACSPRFSKLREKIPKGGDQLVPLSDAIARGEHFIQTELHSTIDVMGRVERHTHYLGEEKAATAGVTLCEARKPL